MKYRVEIV